MLICVSTVHGPVSLAAVRAVAVRRLEDAETRLVAPPMVDAFHLNLTLAGTTAVRQGGGGARTTAFRSGAIPGVAATGGL